eukprot:TRINITY_DN803_c0_g2_i1.p1 TRINITY_DN803_c0_g2~~TRINITY_DN803_c0_g2_i1.p1  ORF type:complete len:515 (+),score=188.98 TRINITY_DN803_c0_g2_i1:82-1545(+)
MAPWLVPSTLPEDLKATGVCPLWIEAYVTAPFEVDTLPLLFCDDEPFERYYDVLSEKHPRFSEELIELRNRNRGARQYREQGEWRKCIDSLENCIGSREFLFPKGDWQVVGAARHLVLTMLTFADAFLRQALQDATTGVGDDALTLYRSAAAAAQSPLVGDAAARFFLSACVASNWANYFHYRRRESAGLRQVRSAASNWRKAQAPEVLDASAVIAVRPGLALCFEGRFHDAKQHLLELLPGLLQRQSERDPYELYRAPRQETFHGAPVRFRVVLPDAPRRDISHLDAAQVGGGEGSPVAVLDAVLFAAHFNIALCYAVERRLPQCAEHLSMGEEISGTLKLGPYHPWRRQVQKLRIYLDNIQNPTPEMRQLRTAPRTSPRRPMWALWSPVSLPEAAEMHAAVARAENLHQFGELISEHRAQRKEEWKAERRQLAQEEAERLRKAAKRGEDYTLAALGYKMPSRRLVARPQAGWPDQAEERRKGKKK